MKEMLTFEEFQTDRYNRAEYVAQRFGAEYHFRNVTRNNPSKNLPYHNNQHSYTVALQAVNGGLQHKLDDDQLRILFIAGLYHDWNHTGTGNENENIARAVAGCLAGMRAAGDSDKDMWTVMFLIYATASNFVVPSKLPLLKAIIRDADLMQNFEFDYPVFFEGLSEELGFPVTVETTKTFLETHLFHTQWGATALSRASHLK